MKTFAFACSMFAIQVVTANAADMPLRTPQPTPPITTYWNGFYVGVNAGYAQGDAAGVLSPSPDFLTINPSPQMFDFIAANGTNTIKSRSFEGGFQAGYKAQFGAVVLGGEVDWSHVGLSKATSSGLLPMPDGNSLISYSQSTSLTQMATFRAIAGVPIGSFLPYVTGGLALGSTSFSQTIQVPTQPGTCVCWAGQSSGVKAGWVAGAGLQQALTARISVKVEYLYSDLGSRQFTTFGVLNGNPGLDFTHTAHFTSQTVKVGLNFGL